jgi:hypothetical protein
MNLLTFLGTADYKITTYTLNSQGYRTCYCPAAVAYFCRPETTLVAVTAEAKAKHFETLADEIAKFTRPVPVPIPEGRNEVELWQIFEALTHQVAERDELAVDITNGFRSLPFLSFLAIAFLRLARRVKVQHVYYGAFEARDQATNESPIFDLTPFVTLLDWTIATDRFTRFGDATDLASLLKEGIPPGHVLATDLQARKLRDALKQAAMAMEHVSLALRLTRPLETMIASVRLAETLNIAGPLIKQQARPFALLADHMGQAYQSLALKDPLTKVNWPINLQIQLDLIERYLDQGQVVQAVTLAREWLVSLLVYQFQGDSLIDDKTVREPVEFALSNEAERLKDEPRPRFETSYDHPLQALLNHQEIGKVWSDLTQLRNDLAHVGMNLNPADAGSLRDRAKNLLPRLQALGEIFLISNLNGADTP